MTPELQTLRHKLSLLSSGIYKARRECLEAIKQHFKQRHGGEFKFFIDLTMEERLLLLEARDEFDSNDFHLMDVYIVAEERNVRLALKGEERRANVWREEEGEEPLLALTYEDYADYDCSIAEFFLEVYSTLVICAKCDPRQAHEALLHIREYMAVTSYTYGLDKPEARQREAKVHRNAEKQISG